MPRHGTSLTIGQRYYSPSLGRFINKDPIGEKGGLNIDNLLSENPNSNGPHIFVATVNVFGNLQEAVTYDQMYKQAEAFVDGTTQEVAGFLIGRKFMTGADKINAISGGNVADEAAEDLAQVSWASTPQAAKR